MLVEFGGGPHCTGCAALRRKRAAVDRCGDERAKARVQLLEFVHADLGCMKVIHRLHKTRRLLGIE